MEPVAMGRARHLPAFAGIAFVVLFVAGWLLHAPDVPDSDAPVQEWADWLTDSGNGALALISAYLLVLSALCFVVFACGVVQRIRILHGQGSIVASSVFAFSVAFGVLLAAAGIAVNTGPLQYLFEDNMPDPIDVTVVLQLQSLGYGLGLVAAMLAAAAMIAIATTALRGTLPGWFTVVGYVCAVVLLVAVFFIPMLALPIWVLIASILFLRRPPARDVPAPTGEPVSSMP
jgi:hypothetical protein